MKKIVLIKIKESFKVSEHTKYIEGEYYLWEKNKIPTNIKYEIIKEYEIPEEMSATYPVYSDWGRRKYEPGITGCLNYIIEHLEEVIRMTGTYLDHLPYRKKILNDIKKLSLNEKTKK